MWVIAARMHMDGKAKEWFEAYKLRLVVTDWPEFIDDVEAHFGVGDLPPSTTILGADHLSVAVDASGDISPNVMDKAVEPMELATQMAEPVAASDEMVLTNIGGLSLFLELCGDARGEVCKKTSQKEVVWEEEVADCVLTHIGSYSLFLELGIGTYQELHRHVESNHGIRVPHGPCDTMTVKLEKVQCVNFNQCIQRLALTRLELAGNFDVLFNCLWPTEEMYKFSSPWDPGGSWFPCLVMNCKFLAGYTTGYLMQNLLRDSFVWKNNKSVLAVKLYVQGDPGIMKILMHAKCDVGKLIGTLRNLLNQIIGNQCPHGYVKKESMLYNFGYPSCVEDDTANVLEQAIHINMSTPDGMPWDHGGISESKIQAIAWGQAMFCQGGSVTPDVSLGRIPLGCSLTEGLMQVGSAQPLELGDGRIKIQRRSSQGGHRRTEERK
jgi:hypothetical protein